MAKSNGKQSNNGKGIVRLMPRAAVGPRNQEELRLALRYLVALRVAIRCHDDYQEAGERHDTSCDLCFVVPEHETTLDRLEQEVHEGIFGTGGIICDQILDDIDSEAIKAALDEAVNNALAGNVAA